MNSAIYELTCATCKVYVWQTSRSLKHRYQKYVRCIKQNGAQSTYTLHFWIGAYLESSTTILLFIGGNDVLHYIHIKSNYMFRLST